MAITPKDGQVAELYFRDKDGMQDLVNKLSKLVQVDVERLKTELSNKGGSKIDLEDLTTLLEIELKMKKEDVEKVIIELNGFSNDLNKDSETGRDEIVKLLTTIINDAEPRSSITHNNRDEKVKAGANLIASSIKTFNSDLSEVDKSVKDSKNSFTVLASTIEGTSISMRNMTDALGQSTALISATASNSATYMQGFSQVISSGAKGLMAPFAALAGGIMLAGHAIKGFQEKLDLGRSYGSAGGGNTMVEQLRQMHVTSLIDPAALNNLSQVMSKNFNVGLGINQKEMTRVATKQRMSERVMGKEYADNQMEAINDMKTVLAGQSPSGMMDDLTAQTSALAKTMGVSNKYALEQIKAIHNNSKVMTEGMSGDSAKLVETTLQKMVAQNKASGYTQEYSDNMIEYIKNATTDKSQMTAELVKTIQLGEMNNEGSAFMNDALAQEGISREESLQILSDVRVKGFDGVDSETQEKMLKILQISKQGQEIAQGAVKKRIANGEGTDRDISDNLIFKSTKFASSTETTNKDSKELLTTRKLSSEEFDMNKSSADAAPAIDKLLVTMQQQSGNSEKSKQELEAMLAANIMATNPDKKAEIDATKEKKIQHGMRKSKMGRTEYMASLGASQTEAIITKKAKKAKMTRGDYLKKIETDGSGGRAALEVEGNTAAMNQLNFDSMTTVMGTEITKTVAAMEKGVKGAKIGGVKGSNLKAIVQNPDYENNRVKLVSNPVENLADLSNKTLIEVNNAMERGIMKIVNKAIPYLMDALEYLSDHIREIATGAIMLLGGFLAFKTIMAIGAGIGLLGSIFGTVRMLAIRNGAFSISNIFSKLGGALKGIYNTFIAISKGFLKVAKAPFKIIKAIGKGITNTVKLVPKIINAIKNSPTTVKNGVKKLANVPGTIKQKVITVAKNTGTKASNSAKNFGTKITNSVKNVKTNIVNKSLTKDAKQLKKIARAEALAQKHKISGNKKGAKAATKLATKMKAGLSMTTKLANATSIASKAAVVGAGAFGTAGAAFTKFLGPIGLAVTVAMAGKAAFDGWNNASEVFSLQAVKSEADAIRMGAALDANGNAMRNATGEFIDETGKVIRETATNSQKFSSALGGVVSSLSLGFIDASASAQWFETTFGETWVNIGTIWDNIVSGAMKLWEDIKAIFGPSMESLGEVFDDFVAVVVGPFKAVMALFAGDTERAKDVISGTLNGLKGLFFSIPKFLGDAFIGIFDWFVNLGTKLWGSFTRMMTDVGIWWSSVDLWDEFGKPFIEGIIDVGKAIWVGIKKVWGSITGWIKGLFNDTDAEINAKKTAKALDLDGFTDQSKDEMKADIEKKGITPEEIAALLIANEKASGIGGFGELMNVKERDKLKEILEEMGKSSLLLKKPENERFNIDTETLMNSGKKNKEGLMDLDFSSLKGKSYDALNDLYNDQAAQMTEFSREKLKLMISDSKTETVINAETKTKKRKLERAQNAIDLKDSVYTQTDSEEIAAAKVSVGASGSDTILQKAKDGLSSFGDSISSTFDSVMGKSNSIASNGFASVVAAVKGVNYTGGKALESNGPIMSSATKAGAVVDKKMNMIMGSISAKYESGRSGAGTISTGKGDKGGVSYGTHQMKSEGKNGGVVGKFVKTLPKELKKLFQDSSGKQYEVNSKEFKTSWKSAASGKTKKEFAQKQHDYIKKTHYDVQQKKVLKSTGVDLNDRSKAVQNAAWSTAVQHGGNTNVIEKALKALEKDGKTNNDENLIKAIYAERGKVASGGSGKLARFGTSSKNTTNHVAARFKREEKDALSMLKTEEAMGSYKDGPMVVMLTPKVIKEMKASMNQATSDVTTNTKTPTNPNGIVENPRDKLFNIETNDMSAFSKNYDTLIGKNNDDKTKLDFLTGITKDGEKSSAAAYETQQAMKAMKDMLNLSANEQKVAWAELGDEQKKRIRDAYILLKKQEKSAADAQKTKNGNANASNETSTAAAVKDATKETTKLLVSKTEGAQMAKDLTGGLNTEQQKEAEAKFKELGIDMKWAADKAFSIGNGQTRDSEVDLKKMEQVKNILALIKGRKTKKQVALEQGHDQRMTNVGNTFADKKMKAIGKEDLTGDVVFNKKKADLQTKLEVAQKASMKSGNRDAVIKIEAEQKALSETDAGKADKKLDVNRKIQKLIDTGKTKEARELTKSVFKADYDTHMDLEADRYTGEVATEKQIANGRAKAPIKVPTKTIIESAKETQSPPPLDDKKQPSMVEAVKNNRKPLQSMSKEDTKTPNGVTIPSKVNNTVSTPKMFDAGKTPNIKGIKNTEATKAKVTMVATRLTAEKSGGGIDKQEKLDLTKMEKLLAQILATNTSATKQLTNQAEFTKISNKIQEKAHKLKVNTTVDP